MPRSSRSRPGPMPESSSSCAEPIEPAERMTSPFAARGLARAVLAPGHAGRAPAVELDALGEASGLDPQVRPAHHGLQKSARRRPAPPAPLVDVEIAEPSLSPRLKSSIGLMPYSSAASRNASSSAQLHARSLDAPFAADAVVLAVAEEMVGLLPEQRQHIVPAPAGRGRAGASDRSRPPARACRSWR